MLEKEKGVFKVDKLRAILLMEADFNMANKIIFGPRQKRHGRFRRNASGHATGMTHKSLV